jgi:bacterioferritin
MEVLTMANEKVIAGLQTIVTDLAQQADGHAIQSRVFASEGFSKLADKYAEHAVEERGYVDKCVDRLLDLGADVKLEAKQAAPVCKDPVEWVKYDLQVSKDGLAWLKDLTEAARDDYATYDILKAYYQDEEEDLYWGENQLELIEKIGKQNWLVQQL